MKQDRTGRENREGGEIPHVCTYVFYCVARLVEKGDRETATHLMIPSLIGVRASLIVLVAMGQSYKIAE